MCGQGSGLALKHWQLNNFRLSEDRSKNRCNQEHSNQSNCKADGYISFAPGFLRKRNSSNRRSCESKQ